MPKNSKSTTPPASVYGSGWGGANFLHDLDCPSGALVQVKRVGVQGLIKAGILESLDTLTGIVSTETVPKAEGRPAVDAAAVAADPEKLESMMEMVDKILSTVVNEPKLHPHPQPDEDGHIVYEEGKAYIDLVPIEDKMFIVNFVVGGTADLQSFREESQKALGGLESLRAAGEDAS